MVTKVGSVPEYLLHVNQIQFPAGGNLNFSEDLDLRTAGRHLTLV